MTLCKQYPRGSLPTWTLTPAACRGYRPAILSDFNPNALLDAYWVPVFDFASTLQRENGS
jgi:hypothetical protein